MKRLGAWVEGLTGWRRALFALILGGLSATAFAPFYFFPALLLGFAGLALLLDGARARPRPLRNAAWCGWVFAFGQYVVGLHWLVYPFLVDPAKNLWQLPFALTSLPAFLALYAALACGLAALLRRGGTAGLILLAVLYAAGEWLRGHVVTGFPWNLPAYGWGALPAVMQSAALMGAYGLSFLTILLGVSLAGLARRRYALPGAMVILFAALWGFGAVQLSVPAMMVPGVKLRLVQPDVPQSEMHGRFINRNWQRLMALSTRPGNPTHIIWPEAAAAFVLARSPTALDQIAMLTSGGASLFTGTVRLGDHDDYYNSVYMFGAGGALLGIYDKSHLVPFGEYVPYPGLLNAIGVSKLTEGLSNFSSGTGPHRYTLPGAPPLTPLICYEIIFPGAVTGKDGRPGWFVNVTDDSWFGPWAGPAQHLLTARMRAIEEGIPIARAANTGISAVIDARGRIVAQLGLGRAGIVDGRLPAALAPTPYARFGDWVFALLLLLGVAAAAGTRMWPR